jgi:tRNA 2-thiouridine synthesizing protein A
LRKNVRWLDSIQDGKEAGMRACKRCQPEKEQVLDCVGMLCPLPVLKTRKVLSGMASGQVLLVLTSDRMALIDLPHFCAQSGHDYLDAVETGTDGGKQAHHRIRVA